MPRNRRFRPGAWDALEERVVLSSFGWHEPLHRVALGARARTPAANRTTPAPRTVQAPAARALQTPRVAIDQQYAAFLADITRAARLYFQDLQLGAVRSQPVALVLVSPYAPGDGVFDVGRVDFPPPTPEAPLPVAAVLPDGTARLYQATGAGAGFLTGVQAVNPALDGPLPAGTPLEAQVPFDPAVVGDVAGQYRNYVGQRTLTLSRDLVTYFNRLPVQLPKRPGPYHTHRPRNAIQQFLYNRIIGSPSSSLSLTLLSTPLPASTGTSVELYVATVSTAIENSRQEVTEGVRLLFSGQEVPGLGTIRPIMPAK
jgi:hypothetical protein